MNIDAIKNVGVVGWGRSGVSLCELLLKLKKKVLVTEAKESSQFDAGQINRYRESGVVFEFGGHSERFIKQAELLVLSPGVNHRRLNFIAAAQSSGNPCAQSAGATCVQSTGVTCVGEVEFAFWLTQAKVIAITGTNGKTTTTYLAHQVLSQKRKRVHLGGNIGTPFSSFVLDTRKNDLVVLELSSFQLETIVEFSPYVACLLNIEPDHMDRYLDLGDYLQAKMNIFRNQTESDWAIINRNIDFRPTIESPIRSQRLYFSDEFANENLSCVYRIASVFRMAKADCMRIFSEFKGLPHRLQLVRNLNGVTFINDSKATNPSSTIWALKNATTPVILLAGGRDKGLNFSQVVPFLRRVKKVNLIGEASSKIRDAFAGRIPSEFFATFEEAVKASYREAESGDTVLLSPMCASFDMFSNYEERGAVFTNIVNSL